MKAIETEYDGYRFRSRLEARWAVFFDAMNIEFDYEFEGFELPSGRYLPDFWLPQVKMWAEVKPIKFTDEEIQKCKELKDATGYHCLLLDGPPNFRTYADENYNGIWCPVGGILDHAYFLITKFLGEGRFPVLWDEGTDPLPGQIVSEHDFWGGKCYSIPYGDAVFSARGARFEFEHKIINSTGYIKKRIRYGDYP